MKYSAGALRFSKIKKASRPLLHMLANDTCNVSGSPATLKATITLSCVKSWHISPKVSYAACSVAAHWRMQVWMTWSYSPSSFTKAKPGRTNRTTSLPFLFAKLRMAENRSLVDNRQSCREIYSRTHSAPKSGWWRENGKQNKKNCLEAILKERWRKKVQSIFHKKSFVGFFFPTANYKPSFKFVHKYIW